MLCYQNFVQFLTRTNTYNLHLALWRKLAHDILDAQTRHFRHKYLAAFHSPKDFRDKLHNILDMEPEARHAFIGERERPRLFLLFYELNQGAAATDDVAIAHHADERLSGASAVGICRSRKAFCAHLGRTVEIDGLHRLV